MPYSANVWFISPYRRIDFPDRNRIVLKPRIEKLDAVFSVTGDANNEIVIGFPQPSDESNQFAVRQNIMRCVSYSAHTIKPRYSSEIRRRL